MYLKSFFIRNNQFLTIKNFLRVAEIYVSWCMWSCIWKDWTEVFQFKDIFHGYPIFLTDKHLSYLGLISDWTAYLCETDKLDIELCDPVWPEHASLLSPTQYRSFFSVHRTTFFSKIWIPFFSFYSEIHIRNVRVKKQILWHHNTHHIIQVSFKKETAWNRRELFNEVQMLISTW